MRLGEDAFRCDGFERGSSNQHDVDNTLLHYIDDGLAEVRDIVEALAFVAQIPGAGDEIPADISGSLASATMKSFGLYLPEVIFFSFTSRDFAMAEL